MLKKIYSGGQTGADFAGLVVAQKFGLETGGWIPKGFRTLDGPKPELGLIYGLVEDDSPKYPPRTYKNVKDSDGTIRIAKNFNSLGEICTMNAIELYGKPHFDIFVDSNDNNLPQKVADWIIDNNIEVLNVAGNSEKTSPGTFEYTVKFLGEVIKILKEREKNEEI